MSPITITELPCEIIGAILRNLDNLRSLTPALLACRHFHTSCKQYHGIEAAILRNQITPALLPYSVALLDASRWPRPLARSSVRGLLDTLYNEPTQLSARVPSMPVSILWQMARSHELIRRMCTSFATEAWVHLSERDRGDDSIVLSPTEDFRFCRAFYRLELFYQLFRAESANLDDGFAERTKSWFLSRHSPWENEQLCCVHEFLERRLRQASRDVVAHDIHFGEMGIDYLSTGRDNSWNQLWVSQGLRFIDRLMRADSYEAKEDLLSSAFSRGSAFFTLAMDSLSGSLRDGDKSIEEYSEEELRAENPPKEGTDLDRGPYEAWRTAHVGFPLAASIMLEENAWLREGAYVLWDWARIQDGDLLAVIEANSLQDPNDRRSAEEEYEAMLESFDERSELWQQGMTGYWHGGGDAGKEEGKPDE